MSVEPWDLKIEEDRKPDSLATFIIYCEDGVDEPIYFRSFEKEKKLKVNVIPNQNKGRLNLYNSIQQCKKDELIECIENSYVIRKEIEGHVWCVFDRDLENQNLSEIDEKRDIEFTTSIKIAEAAKIKVGWSNDAFEFWILLHFEEIPTGSRLHRNYVYDRLTQIFRAELLAKGEAFANKPNFSYKNYLKHRTDFYLHVLPLLKERVEAAITRAEQLEVLYTATIPYHDCNPCTKVHNLVKELRKVI